jgi:protein phosphatase 1 regulatory subunit 7
VQKLSIQQNLFGDDAVNVLAQWPALFGMQELVLRDNKLSKIPPLKDFVNLKVLDISFNEVLSLEGMSIVTSRLQELYVQKNEVAKIEELEHLQNLRVLELGSNKIRVHISPTISDTYWLYLPCMILRQMRIREIAEDRNVCSA